MALRLIVGVEGALKSGLARRNAGAAFEVGV